MASIELAILGRILMLQSALHAAPDNQRLGELVCYSLAEIPGVSSAATYIEERLISQATANPNQATGWPLLWHDTPQFLPSDPHDFVSLPLQTNKGNYGFLVLLLAEQQAFEGYLPHLENTVNLIALMIENRQQSTELQRLNQDLEAQVKDRVKSLQRSEERLSLALRAANSGIWDWNLRTEEVFFDAHYFKIAGYDPDEFPHSYEEWKTRVHPDDITQAESQIEAYLADRTRQFSVEFRFKTKQGDWMWILGQGIISERDESGAPIRFTGTHTDIDDRKKAEEKLTRQQVLLENSQELGHIGTWSFDRQLNTFTGTEENARILGFPVKAKVGYETIFEYETLLQRIHPDDKEQFARKWKSIFDGKPYETEFRIIVNGKTKWIRVKANRQIDAKGIASGAIGFTQDITERKLAENALRESEERFRLVFATNPDPVILTRLNGGTIIDVNKAFETVTGIPRNEALEHNSAELPLWTTQDRRETCFERLQQEGAINNFETDFRVTSGQVRTGLLSARLLTINNEPCVLLVIRDITTEKAAEHALIEMDQMKNEFISTAAHELNTPLSAIMGFTEFLRAPDNFGGFSEEQRQDFLNEIYARGEALSRIINELLDISRIESGQPIAMNLEECDLREILIKSVEFFQARNLNHLFRLDLPDEEEIAPALIDQNRMTQVIENLLSNAIKYSPDGGDIIIKCRARPKGCVISIKDHGIGMSTEQIERVFDKFFRADASDTAVGGLGLGMSIVRQIIEAHGGRIQVESVEGQGSTVTFNLPQARR